MLFFILFYQEYFYSGLRFTGQSRAGPDPTQSRALPRPTASPLPAPPVLGAGHGGRARFASSLCSSVHGPPRSHSGGAHLAGLDTFRDESRVSHIVSRTVVSQPRKPSALRLLTACTVRMSRSWDHAAAPLGQAPPLVVRV